MDPRLEPSLDDLSAFAAVARAGGFREAARARGTSASSLSEAVRRLETRLGLRLLHRTTRSVAPTEAGQQLLRRLAPALEQIGSALEQAHASADQPAGTLRLNIPVAASRLVLPRILPEFLAAYPQIRLEIRAEDRFVDILSEGFDAGIRYDERLEQDMVAVPIGPARQRFATAASAGYLQRAGRPRHPRDLMGHACLRGRFSSGAMPAWEFARDGEVLRLEPQGPLLVGIGGATDLAVEAACSGVGIVYLFEDWLAPYFARGELEAVLEPWWPSFSGPFLYYPGQRQLPPALRALVDFIKTRRW